jgi:hypothetical protein
VRLDSHLPRFDVNEVHSVEVRAAPEAALAAFRALTPREVPLTVALMSLRVLPALAARRAVGLSLTRPVLEQFTAAGFVILSDEPGEVVVGGIGRFWRPDGELRKVAPEEFASFAEPGFAKTAFNMRAASRAGGATSLTTETRILATDESARRGFGRYWFLIRLGSGLIRREWLRAIKRRAERSRRAP